MRKEIEPDVRNRSFPNKRISLKKFEGLFDSKKELYYRLTVLGKFLNLSYLTQNLIGQVFLPEKKFCTLKFMQSLLNGKKSFY